MESVAKLFSFRIRKHTFAWNYTYVCAGLYMCTYSLMRTYVISSCPKSVFYCCQYIVNRHSVEVQTFHVYFLWGKSLKYPTVYQAETIYKKRIYSWKQGCYVKICFKTLWEYENMNKSKYFYPYYINSL